METIDGELTLSLKDVPDEPPLPLPEAAPVQPAPAPGSSHVPTLEARGEELVLDLGKTVIVPAPPPAPASTDEIQDLVKSLRQESRPHAAAPADPATTTPVDAASDAEEGEKTVSSPSPSAGPAPHPEPAAHVEPAPASAAADVDRAFAAWDGAPPTAPASETPPADAEAGAPGMPVVIVPPTGVPESPPAPSAEPAAVPARPRRAPWIAAACILAALAVAYIVLGTKRNPEPVVKSPVPAMGTPQPPPPPPAMGTLQLEVAPTPSELWVNGKPVDKADGALKLAPGRHSIRARFEDLVTVEREFDVVADRTVRLAIAAHREIAREIEKRGRPDDARKLYAEALARSTDEAEKKDLHAAIERLAPKAALRVASEPSGAEVLLDGRPVGRTPVDLQGVEPGTRQLEVRLPGYESHKESVEAKAGHASALKPVLKPLPGIVRIAGVRAGDRAKVAPDGGGTALESVAKADGVLEIPDLPPGAYTVSIARAGHAPGQVSATVKPGSVSDVAVPNLSDLRGTLVIEVHPEGSVIEGAVQGLTKARALLEPGAHRVRARHSEAGEAERTVTVRRGEETSETIDLWELQGARHLEGRKLEEAERAYSRAREAAKGKGLASVGTAWLAQAAERRNAGDLPAARSAAERAQRLLPGDARAREEGSAIALADAIARAEKARAAGDWGEVKRAAAEATAIRPEHPQAKALAAEAAFQEALGRAREAQRSGRKDEATAAYLAALVLRPDHPEAKAELAKLSAPPAPRETRAIAGEARAVAFRPDGASLAAGTDDGKLVLRATSDLSERSSWPAHAAALRGVAFSSTGERLATWSEEGAILAWDLPTGGKRNCPLGATGVRSVAFSSAGDRVAAGYEDGAIMAWLLALGEAYMAIGRHGAAVTAVAFGEGEWLASGSADGEIKVWDAARGTERRASKAAGAVAALAFAPSGRTLAVGREDGTVSLWNAETGEGGRTFAAGAAVRRLAFSPDGRRLASVGDAVIVWDLETGKESMRIGARSGRLWDAAFHPEGSFLVTAGSDGLKVWDTPR